jgi:hypothetical protein
MAHLQGARKREYKGNIFLFCGSLADCLDVWWRARGQPAGEGRVAVDVELEEVEEGVGDGGDGAVLFGFDAVVELKRLGCLVADWEGDPLDLVRCVLDVLARFSAAGALNSPLDLSENKMCSSSFDQSCRNI